MGALVIVEGIDRVGKTTLVNQLKEFGYIDFKDHFTITSGVNVMADISYGKCETAINFLVSMVKKGYRVVMDRCYLTEVVYGLEFYRAPKVGKILQLQDWLHKELGDKALLVYVKPDNIYWSNDEAHYDQTAMSERFDMFVEDSPLDKVVCDFTKIKDGSMAYTIANMQSKYDFYLASPWFNEAQSLREREVLHRLKECGYKVFSPRDNAICETDADSNRRQAIFKGNVDAIKECKAVFAITNDKDMGTIFEAGYAYAYGKPIVYFAEGLNGPFNLMLAESGVKVLSSYDEIDCGLLSNLKRGNYVGGIE